jgi:hypothetical protein
LSKAGPTLIFSHLNSSTPWRLDEYEVQWKRPPYAPWGFDYYPDFEFNNGSLICLNEDLS